MVYAVAKARFGDHHQSATSVGIDLKELGGQLPKCLKFCPGIEI